MWPTTTGARLRNFHLATALAARCQVTLVQLRQPGEDVVSGRGIEHFEQVFTFKKGRSYTPAKILSGLIGPQPIPVANYSSPSVSRELSKVLSQRPFDAVQLEGVHLLNYLPLIRALPNPPSIVVDWHNIESELMRRYAAAESNWARRLVAQRTASLLARAEASLLRGARIHTVPSHRERELLLAQNYGNDVRVVPNGVDSARFAHLNPDSLTGARKRSLLFVGSMDYHANIDGVNWFARQIWPAIRAEFPDLLFDIVGRDPAPAIRELASESIRVAGTVNDLLPYYGEAFAVIVPLRVGGGTRLKILEAMAAGVPVISTSLGAEGIALKDGHEILLADAAEQIRAALHCLRQDPEFRQRLIHAARSLVREQYDWGLLGEHLYRIHLDGSLSARKR